LIKKSTQLANVQRHRLRRRKNSRKILRDKSHEKFSRKIPENFSDQSHS
jgi:hypothetical protein